MGSSVLPPLLFSSAVAMPVMDFRRAFGVVSGLSIVLVVVSSLATTPTSRRSPRSASAWPTGTSGPTRRWGRGAASGSAWR
jgi:hypothetical protein